MFQAGARTHRSCAPDFRAPVAGLRNRPGFDSLTPPAPGRAARSTEDRVLSHSPMAARPAAAKAHPARGASKPGLPARLLGAILSSLERDKAEDVVAIALSGKSEMADHMVVCSGRSARQVVALAEKLGERLKRDLGLVCRFEGKDQGDWVLIDAGDVIVHVFRPEVREFYQLEKMWAEGGAGPARG